MTFFAGPYALWKKLDNLLAIGGVNYRVKKLKARKDGETGRALPGALILRKSPQCIFFFFF